jgi:prepilin-type N-terminal cleavage/methylation domain-containing protein
MNSRIKKLNTIGDTLVEVLICVAIISLVLAAGYVTTNSSLVDERHAQERNYALQIAQAQLESLSYSVNRDANFYNDGGTNGGAVTWPFCFTDPSIINGNGSLNTAPANLSSDTMQPNCYFNSSDQQTAVTLSAGIPFGLYQVAIVDYPDSSSVLTSGTTNDDCVNFFPLSSSSPINDQLTNPILPNPDDQIVVFVQWPKSSGNLNDRDTNNVYIGQCNFLQLVYRTS